MIVLAILNNICGKCGDINVNVVISVNNFNSADIINNTSSSSITYNNNIGCICGIRITVHNRNFLGVEKMGRLL